MSIVKWNRYRDPFDGLVGVGSDFSHLLDWPLTRGDLASARETWRPRVDIHEEKDAYVIEADLPGLTRKDVMVDVEDSVLTLKGTRKLEKEAREDGYYRCERLSGTFERRFELPGTVDPAKIKATYHDGVLTVVVPHAEAEKPRRVNVKIA